MRRCLVIGGCGFLGRHIAEGLLVKGHEVTIFDVRKTFENDKITFVIGDLCNKNDLYRALVGVDVVFHCATPSPLSNNKELFMKVNYEGTRTIIAACKEKGIQKLVLTSSASVLYESRDILEATEDMPYAENPMDHYAATKILQEKLVLEANCEAFRTAAIRPHGIFGPRDPHMLPTLAQTAKAGKTKFILGNGKNIVDFTYVENVVHGHILAASKLDDPNVCGRAFHITNDESLPFWSFMTMMITGLGYPSPRIHLPFTLVYIIAVILSWISALLETCLGITWRPTFSPSTVCLAATHHSYSCARAKKLLGYRPPVSLAEGVRRTLEHFSHLKNI